MAPGAGKSGIHIYPGTGCAGSHPAPALPLLEESSGRTWVRPAPGVRKIPRMSHKPQQPPAPRHERCALTMYSMLAAGGDTCARTWLW